MNRMSSTSVARAKLNNEKLNFVIGDVRDTDSCMVATKGVDYIFHAAALKQVPSTEYNPFEAIKTNIIGAQNIITASLNNEVRKVVALSSERESKTFTHTYCGTQSNCQSSCRHGCVWTRSRNV